jgi:hypothetical protein
MALPIKRRACTAQQTIPKSTFLTMLGPPPEKSYNTQEAYSSGLTRAYFEKLEDSQWSIISFNPETRVTCVQLVSPVGQRLLSVTLPSLSASKN